MSQDALHSNHVKIKRKLRNYILSPRFQFTYFLYFLGYGLIAAGMILAIVFQFHKEILQVVTSSSQVDLVPATFVNLNDIISKLVIALAIFVLLYSIAGLYIAIKLTHRVVGPVIALRKFIGELKLGHYGGKVVLRKNDALQYLQDDLNDLSFTLNEKKNQEDKKS